ncbi:hypothetical protein PsAD2_00649 [Pseudovibrio axinellae]|uniref:FlaG protein n=1 Tax=Pseudovibrio axinellae TaxID=989403 RepID=A0A166ANR4_9HYPH|nr:hypothetical protein [Pseudovibrio axinellae]KZL21358.1 hypothetical protein PsAD2_00649 [Pseudovibrio axinellae]SEQ97357.1 hypothetical protein SAMN05421798_105272 [Pseudovibrio axinellae]
MEIVAQRPTLLHQALSTQVAPVKSETEQVKTELSGARAVTASAETIENQTTTDKPFKSDSRRVDVQTIPQSNSEDTRVVRAYNFDEESQELVYSLTQEPDGDVIYELPSQITRRIQAFVDEIIQMQETRSLGGEVKDTAKAAPEAESAAPTRA